MVGMWQAMESIWPVVLIVMVVFGATVMHLGGIVLERLLPDIGRRIAGGPETPERGEVAAFRRELESSHREADRLHTLEHRVNRIQEQVHFLERLLESEPRGLSKPSKVAKSRPNGDGDGSGGSGPSGGRSPAAALAAPASAGR
jgi:hypothetical protein